MVFLHQEGLDLENGGNKYASLKVRANLVPWSLETNNTKITNLMMEAPYLSTKTVVEKCPDASPDEVERILEERGELIGRSDAQALKEAEKAHNISVNRSNEIVDNEDKIDIEPTTINS